MDEGVNLSVFALAGSAAVRIRHVVERKLVFSLYQSKKKWWSRRRQCAPGWRNKSRDKLSLDLKGLSFSFSSKKAWCEWQVLYKVPIERLQVSGRQETEDERDVSAGTSVLTREQVVFFTREKVQTKDQPPSLPPSPHYTGADVKRRLVAAACWHVWGVKWSKRPPDAQQTKGVVVRRRFNPVQNEAKTASDCSFKAKVAWRWLRWWYIYIYAFNLYGFSHLVSYTRDLWAGFHTSAFLIAWRCMKSILNRKTKGRKSPIIIRRTAAKLLLRLSNHLDTVWLSQNK